MIVSELVSARQRGESGAWTCTETCPLATLDVPLGDPELHPVHPRFPSNAWECGGQWAIHPFQVCQERGLERKAIRPKLRTEDS